MPRVPTYDNQTVAPNALGAPRVDRPTPHTVANSPDFFGGVEAKQKQALGGAMQKTGGDFAYIAIKMQERENADVVQREEVALKEEYLKTEQDWRKNRQGRFADGLTDDANNFWDESFRKASERLANPVQQRMFAERTATLRQNSMHSVSVWQATQLEKSHDESFVANKNATISLTAANPTPENIATTRETVTQENVRQAARKGWSAEVLEQVNVKDLTAMHKNIIQTLVQNDPSGAAAYFEANKGEIDGTQHAEIGGFAKKASATAIGGEMGAHAWVAHGPKNSNDPVDLAKMEDYARNATKGNADAEKAALTRVREMAQAHNKTQTEFAAQQGSTVAKMINEGASLSQVMASPAYMQLSGQEQLKWSKYVEDAARQSTDRAEVKEERRANKAYRDEARGEIRERRADAVRIKGNNAAFFRDSNPTVLIGMLRTEVEAKLPDYGPAHLATLLNRWDELHKDKGKVHAATIDRDAFKVIARDVGLDPDAKPRSEGQARMGAALDAVEREISAEQDKLKRQLNREEKDVVARRVMAKGVLHDSPWYNVLRNDRTLPQAATLPADVPRVVPLEAQKSIREALTKAGRPATNADILRIYLKGNK